MGIINLICGGIEIPVQSSLTLQQTYSEIDGGSSTLRMGDGSLIKQTVWGKTAIDTAGGGDLPLPLQGLDISASYSMQCVSPLTEYSTNNVITLPNAHRTDIDIIAYAVVNGKQQRSPVSVLGNIVTVTALPDATAYHAIYFPVFTVMSKRPKQSGGSRGIARTWSFLAEQT